MPRACTSRASVYALHLSRMLTPDAGCAMPAARSSCIPVIDSPPAIFLGSQCRHRTNQRVVVLENPRRFRADSAVGSAAPEHLVGEQSKNRALSILRFDAEYHDAPRAQALLGGEKLEQTRREQAAVPDRFVRLMIVRHDD